MNRLHLSIVLVIFAAGLIVYAQNRGEVEIITTHLSGPVHMLEGRGGNIGVSSGPDGTLMIDDQFANISKEIAAAIDKIGNGPIKFVLNTHWHGDHTGGNVNFGKHAPIVAHQNVRERLKSNNTEPHALPDITYEQGLSIHFNGEEIKLIHLPHGHTDGDTVVHFTGSNVVHMGDHFFNGRFPYVDLGSGGNVQGFIDNVKMVLDHVQEDTKIIPGHGSLATRADLVAFHAMLLETTGVVRQQMADGKSVDQIKAAGLAENWASWGSGFVNTDRWITTIINSYTPKP